MSERRTDRSKPATDRRIGERKDEGRSVQGGRQPTMQHPKPTGPVNIGKPIKNDKGD